MNTETLVIIFGKHIHFQKISPTGVVHFALLQNVTSTVIKDEDKDCGDRNTSVPTVPLRGSKFSTI